LTQSHLVYQIQSTFHRFNQTAKNRHQKTETNSGITTDPEDSAMQGGGCVPMGPKLWH